jgi:uncharacterized coiled-coil DUF342 family protein
MFLSQVEKPDKAAHDEAVNELTEALEVIKVGRAKVQEQIDGAMSDPVSKAALQEARAKMNAFKTTKGALIDEKKAMRAQLDAAKTQTDKIMKDKKDSRDNVRFNTLQEVEAEISKLQRKQETTTMTLQEEKMLIREMDQLKMSKQFVADLKSKDAAMDNVKEQRKTIGQLIKDKDVEIDAVSKDIDEIMITIKAMNETDGTKRDAIQGLFKERDEYKKQMGQKLKQKDAIRDEFRTQNNAWFNYQRAVRAQKQVQYEEEKKQRGEEKKAYLALLEEEEAKKIPYEAEQALCDFLADYLERTYLGKSEDKDGGEKKADVVAVKDDPFAGMMPSVKKEESLGFEKKQKKKRVRAAKVNSGPFSLSVDSFAQFGLIKMSPPTSVDQVEKSVKDLREKKEWFKVQPRGSIPTAEQIRKANEKGATKQRQATEADAAPASSAPKVGKGPGNFSLSNEDFAPLGAGGAASSMNSSWGKSEILS